MAITITQPRTCRPNTFRSILQNALWPDGKARKTAILFTGGIDSSTLACLAHPLSPKLFFAEIQHPSCAVYNRHSIRHCCAIARKLGLNFQSIPITRATYQAHLRKLGSFPHTQNTRLYPPVTDCLFHLMSQQHISLVISGIGADDILKFTESEIKNYLLTSRTGALQRHQLAASRHHLHFIAPFLTAAFIQKSLATPLENRKYKQPLKSILQSYPDILSLMKTRPRQDSFIPASFLY